MSTEAAAGAGQATPAPCCLPGREAIAGTGREAIAATGPEAIPDRADPDALERLFDAVCGAESARSADERAAARALYRLLADTDGDGVGVGRLAAVLGWAETRAEAFLAAQPNVERDGDDLVVAFGGLSLRPTPHRIGLPAGQRYAWCAWDTLFLPIALDASCEVTSRCPETGDTVALRVGPDGIAWRHPADLRVSFLEPEVIDGEDLRGSFCGQVHFLAGGQAAERWAAATPARLTLDLDDAFALGRRMIAERCGL